jgi:hypothetical protein
VIRVVSLIIQAFIFLGKVIATVVMAPFNAIIDVMRLVASGLQLLFSGIGTVIGATMQALWNLIPSPLRWLIEQAGKGMAWAFSMLAGGDQQQQVQATQVQASAQQYASGGLVRGEGLGTSDRIAAFLSNYEYIMPADVTRRMLPMLEAIRGGFDPMQMISDMSSLMNGLVLGPIAGILGGLTPQSLPQLVSLPRLPVPVPPQPPGGGTATDAIAAGAADNAPIQFILQTGDIHLNGGATQADADAFVEQIEQRFKARLPDWFREFVELRRMP